MRKLPQHNRFQFQLRGEGAYQNQDIIFDSEFDSGNCGKVEQNGPYCYTVYTANDCAGTSHEGHPKSWFYFTVMGFQRTSVKFIVKNLNMLWPVHKQPELYRHVVKIDDDQWQRFDKPVQIHMRDQELELHFEQYFLHEGQKIRFAFSYPYSYTDLQHKLSNMERRYTNDHRLYFNREVLIKTAEGRKIDLLVISSHDGKLTTKEPVFNKNMFPELQKYSRAHKFRSNKPIIFISARVHPGETPGSHTMNGILDFLTNTTDARAYLLRKFFLFYLVPMLNPDGVYSGHYRMDMFNQNLNRYYQNPDPDMQPSCYAVRKLADQLASEKRLSFYCDLHAHGGKQGCFFYGNAIDEFVFQVESQLLAKVLSLNCLNFEFDYCNFSRKHMSAKDRNEDLTKEGCGRVVFFKEYGLIHSYTLEMGFHSNNYISPLPPPVNTHRKYNGHNYEEDTIENANTEIYKRGPPLYTIEAFENIGKALLISILDIFEKNPYSRIPNSSQKSIENLRKELAGTIAKLDRFRKEDGKLQQKLKKVNELIQENFYSEFYKRKTFEEVKTKNTVGRFIPLRKKIRDGSFNRAESKTTEDTKISNTITQKENHQRFKISQSQPKKNKNQLSDAKSLIRVKLSEKETIDIQTHLFPKKIEIDKKITIKSKGTEEEVKYVVLKPTEMVYQIRNRNKSPKQTLQHQSMQDQKQKDLLKITLAISQQNQQNKATISRKDLKFPEINEENKTIEMLKYQKTSNIGYLTSSQSSLEQITNNFNKDKEQIF